MDTPGKERLKKVIDALALDNAQRILAERGIDNMSDEEASKIADDLENTIAQLPSAVAVLKREIDTQLAKNDKPRP